MFGINGSEFLVLIVVAVVVVGPERLPRYSAQLGAWVRTMRGYIRAAKVRVDAELGEQAGDVDWAALDPRRYDPRRIEGTDGPAATAAGVAPNPVPTRPFGAGTADRPLTGDVGAGPTNTPEAAVQAPRDENVT